VTRAKSDDKFLANPSKREVELGKICLRNYYKMNLVQFESDKI